MDVTAFISRGDMVCCHGIFNSGLRKHSGFTLLELINTVAIFSIVVGIGVPSFQHFMATNRASSQINNLVSMLAFTRSEAIKRGTQVTLCQSSNNQSCESSGDWSNGWMLFIDSNKNKSLDVNETLLYTGQALSSNNKITFNGGFGIDNYIVYKPDGSAFPNGSFKVCLDDYPSHSRTLILFRTGRVRLSKNNAQGKVINCS
jgi:type IV fimbrial biogenesis protein FimT